MKPIGRSPATLSPMTDREIGYIAGFFDGEGNISIMKRVKRVRARNWTGFDYAFHVRAANTNLEVLQWIQSKVGGTIYEHGVGGNRKPSWVWHLGGQHAKSFLQMIEPFSITKRRQLQVGFEFLSLGRKTDPSARAALWTQMVAINMKGIRQQNGEAATSVTKSLMFTEG